MSTAAFRFICLLLAFAPAGIAQAQIGHLYHWINYAGGDYELQDNWQSNDEDGGVPDTPSDGAIFDLDSMYNVELPNYDVAVDRFDVSRGDVFLDFASPDFSYTTNSLSVSPSTGGHAGLLLSDGHMVDSGSLNIASTDDALLEIAGSTLTSGTATVGANSGAIGYLTVNDLSSWTGTGTQVIGAEGHGELTLSAHYQSGIFGNHSTQGIATTTAAVLGQAAGGSGVATIHGVWNSGDLTVGDAGTGEVDIVANPFTDPFGFGYESSVGRVQSGTANIAAQPGSSASVSVTGVVQNASNGFATSEWDIDDSLAVGGTSASAGGMGQLTLGPQNVVSVGSDMRIWGDGTLTTSKLSDLSVTGTANLAGTLEFVSPFPGFDPQLNEKFQVLSAAGGVVGAFDSTMLPPLDSGLAWSVEYNATDVMLKVVAGFTGDFDHDGDVDGNDFLVWQRNPSVGNLSDWQLQYGMGAGSSPTLVNAVPEPTTALLLALAFVIFLTTGRPPQSQAKE